MQTERQFIAEHLCSVPPEGINFVVGQLVTFTNDYGVKFHDRRVIGFAEGKVHLSGDSPYWFGIKPEKLKAKE